MFTMITCILGTGVLIEILWNFLPGIESSHRTGGVLVGTILYDPVGPKPVSFEDFPFVIKKVLCYK